MFQEQLQQILDDIINRSGTEVSAAIYYRGKCAAAAAAGGGDVRAKATDRFNIGSISKIYCAAAVMKLVEEKRITLDTKSCPGTSAVSDGGPSLPRHHFSHVSQSFVGIAGNGDETGFSGRVSLRRIQGSLF